MTLAITAGTIYSTLGNNNSLVPMAIKDIANSTGLTAGSYITGDKLEGKDRFLDEFGTQAIWLFGIPVYKKLMDYTMYKALKIDPTFDVRNLSKNRSKLLEKSIEYADSSIKESMIKASKNPKYTKNLAMTKFIVSTALTIASYAGLTKYRHYKTRKDAEKEILAEMAKEKNNKNTDTFSYTKPTSEAFNNLKLKKQTTFTGSIQDFMYNPVKNLMILDGAITAERLAESRNKQELLGYTIKEGSVWLFMYFASKPIQKFLEKAAEKNKEKPASIDLDARVIESKELKENNIDNKYGIEYTKVGDYYIPNLVLEKEEKITLNKYGRLRLKFLKENKKAEYLIMFTKGTLNKHLKEIQETADNRINLIIEQLKKQNNITEEMKNTDQLYWVSMMNNFKSTAEEIILKELIYV